MNLRLKVAIIFSAALLIGYFTGVYTTERAMENSLQRSIEEKNLALRHVEEVQQRLDSLCGDAVLKFVPCQKGLEVCVCGSPDKYLTDQ